jgi:hypothetical protein
MIFLQNSKSKHIHSDKVDAILPVAIVAVVLFKLKIKYWFKIPYSFEGTIPYAFLKTNEK